MRIAIGADHCGFTHKHALKGELQSLGHDVVDCGCHGTAAADYPDAAFAVSEAVATGSCERGILICGSGIGVSIAANKVVGIRAALCSDLDSARMTRLHNDSNVLCLSGDRTPLALATEMMKVWLETAFEGGRHGRRVQKIRDFERDHH